MKLEITAFLDNGNFIFRAATNKPHSAAEATKLIGHLAQCLVHPSVELNEPDADSWYTISEKELMKSKNQLRNIMPRKILNSLNK